MTAIAFLDTGQSSNRIASEQYASVMPLLTKPKFDDVIEEWNDVIIAHMHQKRQLEVTELQNRWEELEFNEKKLS